MVISIIDNVKNKLDEHVSEHKGMMELSVGEVKWLLMEIDRLEKRGDEAIMESGERWAKLYKIEQILSR